MNKTDQETINFASIEQIIHDLRSGKMVIIVDDENRENEGDLIIARQSEARGYKFYDSQWQRSNLPYFDKKQV